MKFIFFDFNYAPLHLAADKHRFDTVQLILETKNIEFDINIISVFNSFYFNGISFFLFN